MPLSRRELLASAPLWLAGCAARRTAVAPPAPVPLARVLVAPERVIRTIVGLRPFRPSGFVVRGEKLDQKVVIHNYGHGGAGITLSWGTAQLAVAEAAQIESRQAAVIGCGVVGLSTARLLRRRQFGDAGRFAFRRYQSLVGEAYGVRWLPLYSLSRDAAFQPPPPESPNSEIEPLYPDGRQLARNEHSFDVPYAYRRYSMLIEPAIYLNALLRDFLTARGDLAVREFRDARELLSLREPLLFNCTGLGSRELFHDDELVPIRGQLSFLLPQPEIEYMTVGPADIYMFPRRDGVLLGGSHERGVWDTQVDPATTDRILRENAALFNAMRTPPGRFRV